MADSNGWTLTLPNQAPVLRGAQDAPAPQAAVQPAPDAGWTFTPPPAPAVPMPTTDKVWKEAPEYDGTIAGMFSSLLNRAQINAQDAGVTNNAGVVALQPLATGLTNLAGYDGDQANELMNQRTRKNQETYDLLRPWTDNPNFLPDMEGNPGALLEFLAAAGGTVKGSLSDPTAAIGGAGKTLLRTFMNNAAGNAGGDVIGQIGNLLQGNSQVYDPTSEVYDPVTQSFVPTQDAEGNDKPAYKSKGYSPEQTLGAALFGGTLSAAPEATKAAVEALKTLPGKIGEWVKARRTATAQPGAAPAAEAPPTAEEVQAAIASPEIKAILDANGIDPNHPRYRELADAVGARVNQNAARVAETPTTPQTSGSTNPIRAAKEVTKEVLDRRDLKEGVAAGEISSAYLQTPLRPSIPEVLPMGQSRDIPSGRSTAIQDAPTAATDPGLVAGMQAAGAVDLDLPKRMELLQKFGYVPESVEQRTALYRRMQAENSSKNQTSIDVLQQGEAGNNGTTRIQSRPFDEQSAAIAESMVANNKFDITYEQAAELDKAYGQIPSTVEGRRALYTKLEEQRAAQAEADAKGQFNTSDEALSTPGKDETAIYEPASRPIPEGVAAGSREGAGSAENRAASRAPTDEEIVRFKEMSPQELSRLPAEERALANRVRNGYARSSSGVGDRPYRGDSAAPKFDEDAALVREKTLYDAMKAKEAKGADATAERAALMKERERNIMDRAAVAKDTEMRGKFEADAKAKAAAEKQAAIDDLINTWKRNEQRRKSDGGARDQYEERTRRAEETYSGNTKYSNRPKGQDSDGRWHIDENGFVLSQNGNPIKFADHPQAARWILHAQKESPDQNFDIHNYPGSSGLTVWERSRTGKREGTGGNTGANARGSQSRGRGDEAGTRPEDDGIDERARQYNESNGSERLGLPKPEPKADGGKPGKNAGGKGKGGKKAQAQPGPDAKAAEKPGVSEPVRESVAPKPDAPKAEEPTPKAAEAAVREEGYGPKEDKPLGTDPLKDKTEPTPTEKRQFEERFTEDGVDREGTPMNGDGTKSADAEKPPTKSTEEPKDPFTYVIEEALNDKKGVGKITTFGVKLTVSRTNSGGIQIMVGGVNKYGDYKRALDQILSGARMLADDVSVYFDIEKHPDQAKALKSFEGFLEPDGKITAKGTGNYKVDYEAARAADELDYAGNWDANEYGTTKAPSPTAKANADPDAYLYKEILAATTYVRGDQTLPFVAHRNFEYNGTQFRATAGKEADLQIMGPFNEGDLLDVLLALRAQPGVEKVKVLLDGAFAKEFMEPWGLTPVGKPLKDGSGYYNVDFGNGGVPGPSPKVKPTIVYSGIDPTLLWPAIKEEIKGIQAGIEELRAAFKGSTSLGGTAKAAFSGAVDIGRVAVSSIRGNLFTLRNRYKGNEAAHKILVELTDHLADDPGSDRAVKTILEEAIRNRTNSLNSRIVNILRSIDPKDLETFGTAMAQGKAFNPTVQGRVRKVLNDIHDEVSAALKEAAQDRLSRAKTPEERAAAKAALEEATLGYVKNYFPRQLDEEKISADTAGFIADATKEYQRLGLSREEAKQAATQWMERELGLGKTAFASTLVPSSVKGRVLPPSADARLNKWYERNPAIALPAYVHRMISFAENTRRFGLNGEKLDYQIDQLARAGMTQHDMSFLRMNIDSALGMFHRDSYSALNAGVSVIQTAGMLRVLPRVLWSSISEPIAYAARTGRAMDGLVAFGNTIRQVFDSGSMQDKRDIAEIIGVINSANHLHLVQNFGAVAPTRKNRVGRITNYVQSKFLERTGLTALTEFQRISGVPIMQEMINRLVRDHANPKKTKSAAHLLAELGLNEKDIGEIRTMLQGRNGNIRAVDILESPAGKKYGDAVARGIMNTIQETKRVDKPVYANHPYVGLVYGITGFQRAFTRNLLYRQSKLLGHAAANVARGQMSASDAARLAIAPGIGMLTLLTTQYAMAKLRDQITNPTEAEQRPKELSNLQYMSRTGIFGNLDPYVNAGLSLKYNRDLSQMLAGPYMLGYLQDLQKMVALAPPPYGSNSPNSNTAEWNAARGLYTSIISPTVALGLSIAPGGPILTKGYGLLLNSPLGDVAPALAPTTPEAAGAFATGVAGERPERWNYTGQGSGNDSRGRGDSDRSGARGRTSDATPMGKAATVQMASNVVSESGKKYTIRKKEDGSMEVIAHG